MTSVKMTKTEEPSFHPYYHFDADSVKRILSEVETAVGNQDQRQIIECVSQAYAKVYQTLIALHDAQAWILLMQGKFDKAIKSMKNIIPLEPTAAIGYLRLGDLYRAQGKQIRAIEAYNLGLKSAAADDPDFTKLMDGKALAITKCNAYVDFVEKLPSEIVDDIVTLLPPSSKLAYLTVSKLWYSKISKCSNLWRKLTVDGRTEHEKIASMLLDIAGDVEDLTLAVTDCRVFLSYINGMSIGGFAKLKSLKLDANATRHISLHMVVPISRALWQISNTLTALVFHLHRESCKFTLVDVLVSCSNLESLVYSTQLPLAHALGEVTLLSPHNTLVDMKLEAESITKSEIQKLFPKCQQLRRLLLYGCDTTVLDIVDRIWPNLETFGYNPISTVIPELDYSEPKSPISGLRRFYTRNGGEGVPASAVLPLIQRNMRTLEIIYILLSSQHSQSNLAELYANLKLKNLSKLTFWGATCDATEPLLLQSISTCNTLTHVNAVECINIQALVRALGALSQLEALKITHTQATIGEADLIRLFERYASDPLSERRLKTVWLRNCRTIVTDSVLAALAGISTLEEVTFRCLPKVTTHGLSCFFNRLNSRLSVIVLTNMEIVTNTSLASISENAKGLKDIWLEQLENISDTGIMDLIARMPKLTKLTVKKCGSITQIAIGYAREKVDAVVYTR